MSDRPAPRPPSLVPTESVPSLAGEGPAVGHFVCPSRLLLGSCLVPYVVHGKASCLLGSRAPLFGLWVISHGVRMHVQPGDGFASLAPWKRRYSWRSDNLAVFVLGFPGFLWVIGQFQGQCSNFRLRNRSSGPEIADLGQEVLPSSMLEGWATAEVLPSNFERRAFAV